MILLCCVDVQGVIAEHVNKIKKIEKTDYLEG